MYTGCNSINHLYIAMYMCTSTEALQLNTLVGLAVVLTQIEAKVNGGNSVIGVIPSFLVSTYFTGAKVRSDVLQYYRC